MAHTKQSSVRGRHSGFTLAEVLICSVLIGFMALVSAFGTESVSVQRGEDATVATFLADEIRDMALQMPFTDVLALNGTTYSPVILSTGQTDQRTNWSQVVAVTPVLATNLNQVMAAGASTAARMTVDVRANGRSVLQQTYYIFKLDAVPFTDGQHG
ncbi:MAG: prepilin-type N-terminal cleavage/methylation domain-containing protein [Planctomycetota bacterium]|nr:prepilin-type N-terminal cleavage/methylation domain-containing protein [Planctomycetota bacterium]